MTYKTTRKIYRIIMILTIVAVLLYAGCRIIGARQGGSRSDKVMQSLEQIVPDLGVDTGVSTGAGRDPLAAVSVDGIDIVGVLEVPALDIKAPVASKGHSEEFFATWLDGSPVKGHFKIIASRDDLFRNISDLKPGDRVSFTDIDGVRYNYQVMTQYHLKKWDEGNNDCQLCYKTSDSDTYFVVGCDIIE